MPSNVVVHAEELGKRYRLGEYAAYRTLRESVRRWVALPVRRAFSAGQRQTAGGRQQAAGSFDARPLPAARCPLPSACCWPNGEIWALRDVSFEVHRGQVLGIIGRNGAGKSTLLKILARITKPTAGRATLRGRTGSLLEVGTGFHPELTGRENIFLNGAILGMRRAEIKSKFDQIVAFSGVEKFLDTPVKRYSSGMSVRLAFAVAAHLEPEILLVDEVLAVGDLGFQRKCLGKMRDVVGQGRTVLFVSHNMGAVRALCSQAVLLEDGRVRFSGDPAEAIAEYTRIALADSAGDRPIRILRENFATRSALSALRITDLEILGPSGEPLGAVATGDPVCFRIHFALDEPLANPGFRLRIYSEDRQELLRVSTDPISGFHVPPLEPCGGHIDCVLPRFPFTAGTYLVDVGLTRPMQALLHDVENAAVLEVQGGDFYGSGTQVTNRAGFFVCEHLWRFEPPA